MSATGVDRHRTTAGLHVVTVETSSLGDRSYLVHDGSVAFVVDPQRDIDRVLEVLDRERLSLTHVFETHVHNDYVTGGLTLARETGAAYLLNGADEVAFDREPLRDGQLLEVGDRMRVEVVATPGHTFHHLSYVLRDRDADLGRAVFSGGSLLYGSTGRPDLLGEEHTDRLARLQHGSAHRLGRLLPDDARLYPTHGFGSFCSATQSDAVDSTIGDERRTNPVLVDDEATYVRELLAGLGPWPSYYAHIAPLNVAGPGRGDLTPPREATAAEIRRRIDAGEWVVDLRGRTAFATGHVRGSVNVGLDGAFATNLGWLFDWGTPLTLLGSRPDEVAAAQVELMRIGIERPVAATTGSPERWDERPLGSFEQADFPRLAAVLARQPVDVLDVRRAEEFDAGHIDGAVNVPLHELRARHGELPRRPLWIHCQSGYRASIAASLLAAEGRDVVAVDDHFGRAADAGLPVLTRSA
ncbi:MBL fold metallo-hydrolase [Nocardioides sp. LMS-CY]|uniref:Glyoxylase-like metal-dependent hydrolase (Beta-lactamase superfamily II)/rhodanese-related sulfurtransferase n=1 Tax=Nocardioides soli TaxID=1036020 RepID=A0A7W4VS46_9ACTN|nr:MULTISPECIES: MBL fold metallo-hydrolase [Nocardioides]MBB3040620.1 glyoxylase-like metal-dependent hydrolase (beta-lactamase superfamily II)/rhodanese-related sulfurtransferase [Nocardioides soli]QWF23921.1 MBL fold metallo-hydrolase [Nocardioides sp. LMS-CY]